MLYLIHNFSLYSYMQTSLTVAYSVLSTGLDSLVWGNVFSFIVYPKEVYCKTKVVSVTSAEVEEYFQDCLNT